MNTKTRKSSQPGKSVKSTPAFAEQSEPGSASDEAAHQLVRIHDLTGRTAIRFPAELLGILGDEAYERNLEELYDYELYMIMRQPADVIYLTMPVFAVSFEPSGPSSQGSVEAPKPKAKPKPKRKNGKSGAKPAA